VGSSPDEVTRFANSVNPSSRTMALGSTKSLTEVTTGRNYTLNETCEMVWLIRYSHWPARPALVD
jgi:hypothetical protein